MRYYFGAPKKLIKTDNYIELYQNLMNDNYADLTPALKQEYQLFLLESCRVYVDGLDRDEKLNYYELVSKAYEHLLIHKDSIERSFKDYINNLFSNKKIERKSPQNLSETVIGIMLSELDIKSILNHVNLGTQEVDMKGVKDSVKLERINSIKRLHDKVLFFVEYYNRNERI